MAKVSPGGKLRIKASTWNTVQQMANEYLQEKIQGGQFGMRQFGKHSGIVDVRNTEASDYAAFSVMGIDGPVVEPTGEAIPSFLYERVHLDLVDPVIADHTGRFVVTIGPIAAGDFGKAVVSGLAIVRIYWEDIGMPEYADVKDAESDYLLGASTGSARVLWMHDTEIVVDGDTYWGIVNLGVGTTEAGGAGGFIKITGTSPLKGDWKAVGESTFDTNGGAHYDVTDEGNGYTAVDDVFPAFDWGDATYHIASIYHRAKDV